MKKGEKTNKNVSEDIVEVMTSRSDGGNEHAAEERYREAYGPIDPKKRLDTWQLRERLIQTASN